MSTNPFNSYPWHQTQWHMINQFLESDRMPHALILLGPSGMGKEQFSKALVAALLCKNRDKNNKACGQCQPCTLLQHDNYPDIESIKPEENSKVIKIEQVRALVEWNAHSSHHNDYKIVVMDPLEALNTAAANALLKLLEEPHDNRLFILICNQAHAVPATVLSRCQVISFERCDESGALHWLSQKMSREQAALLLRLSFGSPLKAAAMLEDDYLALRSKLLQLFFDVFEKKMSPIIAADVLQKHEFSVGLAIWDTLLIDVQKMLVAGPDVSLINGDQAASIERVCREIDLNRLLAFSNQVVKLKKDIENKANFNKQLQWEDVLIGLGDLIPRSSG